MSSASVKTLLDQIDSGKLKSDKAIVLNYVKKQTEKGNATIVKNLREKLLIPHQTITARLSDLEDLGLVYKKGDSELAGSHYCNFFYEANEEKRAENRLEVRKRKFKKWLNKADEFEDLIGCGGMLIINKLKS